MNVSQKRAATTALNGEPPDKMPRFTAGKQRESATGPLASRTSSSGRGQEAQDVGDGLARLAQPLHDLPDGTVDVALIGDGVSSRYTAAFIAELHNELPQEQQVNPNDEEGHLRMVTIGPDAKAGAGVAYTEDRGYADDELMNLLDRQVQFTRAVPAPIDAELLKRTIDIDERRLAGGRPYDYGEDYVHPDNGLPYSLASDRRNSYSLEDFNRSMNPGPDVQPNTVYRRNFGRYIVHCVDRAVGKNDRVHMDGIDGEVVKVRYDEAQGLFDLTVRTAEGQHLVVQARNVVLAIGHHPDHVPTCLEKIAGTANFHSGEGLFRFLKDVPEQAQALRGKRGLIVGTGLMMNDIAVKLHRHGVDDFVAVSRSGHTHELPLEVPGEEMDRIPDFQQMLDKIHSLTDLNTILDTARSVPTGGTDERDRLVVEGMKAALENSRELIDEYMRAYDESDEVDKSPMMIRGQEFDRGRVIRALFSQYAAYRHESLRNQPLTDQLGPARAKGIVAQAIREIDFDPRHASWLTTARTPTTDLNIMANKRLREQGRLPAAGITDVALREDDRYAVTFANGDTDVVDYVLNAAGRHPRPGDPEQLPKIPVVDSLLEDGLSQAEPAGVGIAMDERGRAVPRPGRLAGDKPLNLFPVAPSLSKFNLLFPQTRARDALNNTVGEAVPGLRPLAKQAGEQIILSIYGQDAGILAPEDELDYIYDEDGVEPQLR